MRRQRGLHGTPVVLAAPPLDEPGLPQLLEEHGDARLRHAGTGGEPGHPARPALQRVEQSDLAPCEPELTLPEEGLTELGDPPQKPSGGAFDALGLGGVEGSRR